MDSVGDCDAHLRQKVKTSDGDKVVFGCLRGIVKRFPSRPELCVIRKFYILELVRRIVIG